MIYVNVVFRGINVNSVLVEILNIVWFLIEGSNAVLRVVVKRNLESREGGVEPWPPLILRAELATQPKFVSWK